jgi:hypothetical protein
MIKFTARKKYSVVGGECRAEQWDKMVACYESLGYTVTRLN